MDGKDKGRWGREGTERKGREGGREMTRISQIPRKIAILG
jgi:hypothetical protein